jgi:hypothetical protein
MRVGHVITSLDLVNNHGDAVLLGDIAQALEESRGGMVVTTLTLNRLNNETGDGAVPSPSQYA